MIRRHIAYLYAVKAREELFRHIEGDLHVALGAEVVDLGRPQRFDPLDHYAVLHYAISHNEISQSR